MKFHRRYFHPSCSRMFFTRASCILVVTDFVRQASRIVDATENFTGVYRVQFLPSCSRMFLSGGSCILAVTENLPLQVCILAATGSITEISPGPVLSLM